MTLCELYNPSNSKDAEWQFVTDKVMGGVSQGGMVAGKEGHQIADKAACFRASISLDNRGGFAQMKLDLRQFVGVLQNQKNSKRSFDKALDASDYDGFFIEVKGNNETYNVHLRTSQLWLPWQSFRQTFTAKAEWQVVYFPFSDFIAHKCRKTLAAEALKSLGIVAIGRVFEADICVRSLGVYRH